MTMSFVTGLFLTRTDAECGFAAALEHGYATTDINVVMSEQTRSRWFPPDDRQPDNELGDRVASGPGKAAEGGVLGGPAGGTVATLAPVVAAVGVVALLPGLGLILAGPVAAAVAAAGAVAVAGGLLGAMVNWGIPRAQVDEYTAAIRRGGILLGLKPRDGDDAAALAQAWRDCGASQVHPSVQ